MLAMANEVTRKIALRASEEMGAMAAKEDHPVACPLTDADCRKAWFKGFNDVRAVLEA